MSVGKIYYPVMDIISNGRTVLKIFEAVIFQQTGRQKGIAIYRSRAIIPFDCFRRYYRVVRRSILGFCDNVSINYTLAVSRNNTASVEIGDPNWLIADGNNPSPAQTGCCCSGCYANFESETGVSPCRSKCQTELNLSSCVTIGEAR